MAVHAGRARLGAVPGGGGCGDGVLPLRHEYVGDEGDYAKLAFLRRVMADLGGTLGVNWYLTVHREDRPGGAKMRHLDDPDAWEHLDADLLDRMIRTIGAVPDDQRRVSLLQRPGLLPAGTTFHGTALPTSKPPPAERIKRRMSWHVSATERMAPSDVVFLDPDNGLEVSSCPPGSRWFCKYAAYGEASAYLAEGRLVIAYQHRPRATWVHAAEHIRHQVTERGLPSEDPGVVGFGERGFVVMHNDARRIAEVLACARSMKARAEDAGWTALPIHIDAPQ